ncbi:MAG: hypothetical protein J5602_08835 [Clostridia bacterium]|nr:hypothetical protein [Clostridia bacterium]
MNRHEFSMGSYAALTWQLLVFSLAAAYALSRFLQSDMAWLVWLLPVGVLGMTTPYIVRVGEMLRDLRAGRREKARLRLKDVSEEYAIAIHRRRGMVHWTLIFEDESRPGALFSLSVAARRSEMKSFFALESYYMVEWLPTARVIRSAEAESAV